MCRNPFLNFYTLPLICYNISKMASIEVKLITSSAQTRIQVVVSGTDLPATFCFRICMSRIPCLRLCPTRKQVMHAGLLNLEVPQHSAEESFRWSPPRGLSSWCKSPTRKHISSNTCHRLLWETLRSRTGSVA